MKIHRSITRLIDHIPDTIQHRLCGAALVILGILSAIASEENGSYDITAAMFIVPFGLIMVFGK